MRGYHHSDAGEPHITRIYSISGIQNATVAQEAVVTMQQMSYTRLETARATERQLE